MLFSEKSRFVFVAVPKTGTTSIQSHLLQVDPELVRNRVLDAGGEWRKMPTHATVAEIRQAKGPRAAHYQFVAFFRDPRELIRSKYFFYRNGRPAKVLLQGGVRLPLALRVVLARSLPLPLWAVLYPFRSGARFVTDASGRVDVDELGDYADLAAEMRRIFSRFGYRVSDLQLPRFNVTDYARTSSETEWLELLVGVKLAADLTIYRSMKTGKASIHEKTDEFE